MTEKEFKDRTKRLAVKIVRLVEELPRTRTCEVLGRQLLRSGTSVGANYRAACRGVSTADVISKLGDVEEEADESIYWMELLVEAGCVAPERVAAEMAEMEEILRMIVASIKTLRTRQGQSKIGNRQSNGTSDPQSKIQNPQSKME